MTIIFIRRVTRVYPTASRFLWHEESKDGLLLIAFPYLFDCFNDPPSSLGFFLKYARIKVRKFQHKQQFVSSSLSILNYRQEYVTNLSIDDNEESIDDCSLFFYLLDTRQVHVMSRVNPALYNIHKRAHEGLGILGSINRRSKYLVRKDLSLDLSGL